MVNVLADEDALRANLCRASFYDHVREFWSEVIEEKPVWNWHIKWLCDDLQLMAERMFLGLPKEYDEIINISPGTTKSTIASVMFPGWLWARKPSTRFIGASFIDKLSLHLSLKSRDVVESEKYRTLFPYIEPKKDQWTKSHWANTRGGSRYATTVGGGVMGMHGHAIGIDDPLDPLRANSEAELETAKRWVTETIPSRKVDKLTSFIYLIMQRVHEGDPSGVWLKKMAADAAKKIRHVNLPAELKEGMTTSPPELADFYVNGLMDPERLNRSVLAEALIDLGQYGYAGQYLQDPAPREGGIFKVHRIIIDTPPKRFKKVVRYWDKAGTLMGGCYTVGVKMGLDAHDRLWVLDVQRVQLDAHQREQLIQQCARTDGKNVRIFIEQEGGSGGLESAQNSVKGLLGFRVTLDKVTGSKEVRAYPFADQMAAGNVYMVEAPWNVEFINELRLWPRSLYKDQVDASSGACNQLVKRTKRAGAY